MIVQLNLTDAQARHLLDLASKEGFRRAEPRRRWADAERKEAIRWVLLKVSDAHAFADRAKYDKYGYKYI